MECRRKAEDYKPSPELRAARAGDCTGLAWVLPPPSNSWIIIIIWLYIALNRTPNIDCYWVGAVRKV